MVVFALSPCCFVSLKTGKCSRYPSLPVWLLSFSGLIVVLVAYCGVNASKGDPFMVAS